MFYVNWHTKFRVLELSGYLFELIFRWFYGSCPLCGSKPLWRMDSQHSNGGSFLVVLQYVPDFPEDHLVAVVRVVLLRGLHGVVPHAV